MNKMSIEQLMKFLNFKDVFKKEFSKYIESIIKFYGEENRNRIEEILSNITVVPYMSVSTLEHILNETKKQKINQLIIPLLEKNCYLYDLIVDKKYPFENDILISNIITFIHMVYKNDEQQEIDYKKLKTYICNNLKKVYPYINDENIESNIKNKDLNELIEFIKEYKEKQYDFLYFMNQFKIYEEYLSKHKSLKNKLEDTEFRRFIIENKCILSKKTLKELENSKDILEFVRENEETRLYFGYSLNQDNIISFSKDSDEILNHSENNKLKKQIVSDRIYFFNKLGIKLGNNYNDYIKNDEVRKAWPSYEIVNMLMNSRKKHIINVKKQLLNQDIFYLELKKEIDNLNLNEKDIGFNYEMYDKENAWIEPNFITVDGEYKMHPLFYININDNNINLIDHFTIHELNHVIELSINNIEKNKANMMCGWDDLGTVLLSGNNKKTSNEREYEIFNEVINELISIKISEKMLENNLCVFNTKEIAKYKNVTSYDHALFLVKEFYEKFEEDILKSRINGNINIIFDKVGKDNFIDLNNLIKIFNDKVISKAKHFKMHEQLNKCEETELTKIYYDLIEQKDIILSNMQDYFSSKKNY